MAKSINIPVTASTAPLRKSLQSAQSDLTRFGNQASASMKKTATAVLAAGAAAGFVGTKWFKMAEQAYIADRRIEQVAISMGLFGVQTSKTTTRLQAFADEVERETGVMAETVKLAQAKLLTFRQLAMTADEAGSAFDRATRATVDMAAVGFGSAEQNAVQLGKALEDPIKGVTSLRRSGITFTEAEREKLRVLVQSNRTLEAQKVILDAVESQVKGAAVATRTSTQRMRMAFGEVTDAIATLALPAMQKLADRMVDIGRETTTGGLKAGFMSFIDQLVNLQRNADGSVSWMGRLLNGFRRLVNPVIEVVNAIAKVTNALRITDVPMIQTFDTLSDLTGEFKKAHLASKGFVEQLSGLVVFGGKAVETQEQLNAVMGPVASRNLVDFKAFHAAYLKSLRDQKTQAERTKDAEAKRYKTFKEQLADAKEEIRAYIAALRDSISASVSLATAVSDAAAQQAAADEAVTRALEDRKAAYEALNQAQRTNDVEAYNKALQDVAASEQAVTAAQNIKPKNYTQIFAEQIAAAKEFAKNLQTLIGQGNLSKAAVAQLMELGPVAGNQVVKDLLAGTGPITAASLSQDLADVAAAGTAAGMAMPGFAATLAATPARKGPDKYEITVKAGVGDPAEIAKQVVEVLKTYNARFGKIPIKVG